MIQAILFDFWGTLVENGVWSPVKQIRTILDIKIPFPEYVVRMEMAMMSSRFDSLKEAFEEVGREFDLKLDQDLIDQLIGLWNKSWMLAKPYPETVEILTELSQKYKLGLVSNTDYFSIKNVLEKFNLSHYFTKIFLSCDMGMIKSDLQFMPKVLAALSLDPEDCLMVGDSIESDIKPAENNGVKSILIDRKDMLDKVPKIKDLKELKNFLP
ncbi:MAG TPA: HAD family hydrolase [Candidatus Nanoarchaeia archaeon]|nr:HAD family hydrolase [Candidatus Nanoarchaeia archaeon]